MSNSTHTWGAQVDPTLNEKLEDIQEERGLSKSETVRQVMRRGVEEEDRPQVPEFGLMSFLTNVANFTTLFLAIAAAFYFFSPYFDSAPQMAVLVLLTLIANGAPLAIEYRRRGLIGGMGA